MRKEQIRSIIEDLKAKAQAAEAAGEKLIILEAEEGEEPTPISIDDLITKLETSPHKLLGIETDEIHAHSAEEAMMLSKEKKIGRRMTVRDMFHEADDQKAAIMADILGQRMVKQIAEGPPASLNLRFKEVLPKFLATTKDLLSDPEHAKICQSLVFAALFTARKDHRRCHDMMEEITERMNAILHAVQDFMPMRTQIQIALNEQHLEATRFHESMEAISDAMHKLQTFCERDD